mmetsp:Transcript_31941/g.76271  ORF Transcript_31941/g.76271 Transcript_31941/m.76271 type:complete len:229 (-) Transcript_31941:260-946(-)
MRATTASLRSVATTPYKTSTTRTGSTATRTFLIFLLVVPIVVVAHTARFAATVLMIPAPLVVYSFLDMEISTAATARLHMISISVTTYMAATIPVSAVRLGSRLGVFILLNAKGFLLRVLQLLDQLDLAGIVHARVIVVVVRHSVRDTKAIDILPDLSRFGSICVEFRPDRPRRARSSSGSMKPVPRLYDSAKGFRMCTQCSTSRVTVERTRILLWKGIGIGVDKVVE